MMGRLHANMSESENMSFASFITRVERGMEENLAEEDQHWVRQSRMCGLQHWLPWYQHVLYMDPNKSKQEEVLPAVLKAIAIRSPLPQEVLWFNWTQGVQTTITEHGTNRSRATQYDEQLCRKAQMLYTKDYELFRLPRPTCQAEPPFVHLHESREKKKKV